MLDLSSQRFSLALAIFGVFGVGIGLMTSRFFYLGLVVSIISIIITAFLNLGGLIDLSYAMHQLVVFGKFSKENIHEWIPNLSVLIAECVILVFVCFNQAAEDKPDVSMAIVDFKTPTIELSNSGSATALQVLSTPALFDLDAADHFQPLPIQSAGADFIHPGQKTRSLMQIMTDPASLRAHRIFGSIGLSCSNCPKGRTYWVYLELGKSGWFFDDKKTRTGAVHVPRGATDIRDLFPLVLQTLPLDQRIPIK